MKSQQKASEFTLSEQEVQNLINSTINFEHRMILKCLYYAGMRVFEVAALKVEDVDLERKLIHVRKGKGGKHGTIPFIDATFYADMSHYIGKRTSGNVFTIRKRWMQEIVRNAGERAKITHPNPFAKHINPHLMRHSIARHLKSNGYPAEFLKNFLRHESINTTYDQYGTMGIGEMQQIAARKRGDTSLLPKETKRVPEVLLQ
jgi:integrase